MLRVIMTLLMALACASAQVPGKPLRTGDPAPEVTPAKVLQSPHAAPWNWAAMRGKVVVLALSSVWWYSDGEQWNEIQSHFPSEPVEFVAVADEPEFNVQGLLRVRPVNGWVVLDPQRTIAQAFGIPRSGTRVAIVDANGMVAGYADLWRMRSIVIRNVLRGEHGGLDNSPVRVLHRFAPALTPAPLPDFQPSYEVHIAPTARIGAVFSESDDRWIARALSLEALILRAFRKDVPEEGNLSRTGVDKQYCLDFPPELDDRKRYDVILILPKPDPDAIPGLIRQAIQEKFHLTITREIRATDVYVLRAPNGRPPQMLESPSANTGITFSESLLDFRSAPISRLAGLLRNRFERPVIDETNLKGYYSFVAASKDRSPDGLIRMVRDQLGLAVTAEQRPMDFLVVRSQPGIVHL